MGLFESRFIILSTACESKFEAITCEHTSRHPAYD